MNFIDRYPIVVTPHKDACREHWVRHLGFEVGFDSDWFVWLRSPDGSASIAFMTPEHPSAPPGPQVFCRHGVCFELQMDDAHAAHAAFIARDGRVDHALTDELFGQRRFGFADPSGLWVDVVQQIDPAAGYWERYTRATPAAGP